MSYMTGYGIMFEKTATFCCQIINLRSVMPFKMETTNWELPLSGSRDGGDGGLYY